MHFLARANRFSARVSHGRFAILLAKAPNFVDRECFHILASKIAYSFRELFEQKRAFCKIITVATSLFRAPWGKRLFTEFEKLSHQEKYQAVRDTQIMAQMKEKVIKQHDETSKDGAVPVDACVWGNSDQAYDTPHTGRYNL